jgi:hypothetical protein
VSTDEQVIRGARETRISGNYECVNPYPCDGRHAMRLLVSRPAEEDE